MTPNPGLPTHEFRAQPQGSSASRRAGALRQADDPKLRVSVAGAEHDLVPARDRGPAAGLLDRLAGGRLVATRVVVLGSLAGLLGGFVDLGRRLRVRLDGDVEVGLDRSLCPERSRL